MLLVVSSSSKVRVELMGKLAKSMTVLLVSYFSRISRHYDATDHYVYPCIALDACFQNCDWSSMEFIDIHFFPGVLPTSRWPARIFLVLTKNDDIQNVAKCMKALLTIQE